MSIRYASAQTLPQGFFVPPEDAPHERTFMQWPASRTVHPDRLFLDDLQNTILELANTISQFEPVCLLMKGSEKRRVGKKLSKNVEVWDVPTDDLWCRDSGPLFAVNSEGRQCVSGITFNGWGGKQIHENDARIAGQVAARLDLPLYPSGLTGEPGGVEWDGDGTLLAHESCWVNPNRNNLSRGEIEARLLRAYGARKMIWAPGVAGHDITDDHIDALARFINPEVVLFQTPFEGDTDVFSQSARKTLAILREARNAHGRHLEIVEIPSPERTRVRSNEFVSSYVNYYVCNNAVLCAQFGDPATDKIAAETLQTLYPSREIVTLNIDPIGEIGGGIHCATQQQPKVT